MCNFNDFLMARDIDCETLSPELKTALLGQWLDEQMASEPPDTSLVISDDEVWPHAYRVPAF